MGVGILSRANEPAVGLSSCAVIGERMGDIRASERARPIRSGVGGGREDCFGDDMSMSISAFSWLVLSRSSEPATLRLRGLLPAVCESTVGDGKTSSSGMLSGVSVPVAIPY